MLSEKPTAMIPARPYEVAVVLGSGLSPAVEAFDGPRHSYGHDRIVGVAGHPLSYSGITHAGLELMVFSGRRHLYEARMSDVIRNILWAHKEGCRTLILTNMVGAVDPIFKPGKPVLIADHINLTGQTPLSGPQFIDLADAYSPRLRDIARKVRPDLWEATYAQLLGPTYETPAEVKMLRAFGVGLVGMSVAIETIQARALGMEVLAISVPADVPGAESITHEGVLDVAAEVAPEVGRIIAGVVSHLSADDAAYAGTENRFHSGEVM